MMRDYDNRLQEMVVYFETFQLHISSGVLKLGGAEDLQGGRE